MTLKNILQWTQLKLGCFACPDILEVNLSCLYKNTQQTSFPKDTSLCYAHQNIEPGAQSTNHICKTNKQQSMSRK